MNQNDIRKINKMIILKIYLIIGLALTLYVAYRNSKNGLVVSEKEIFIDIIIVLFWPVIIAVYLWKEKIDG
jgi:hypothetical protein